MPTEKQKTARVMSQSHVINIEHQGLGFRVGVTLIETITGMHDSTGSD